MPKVPLYKVPSNSQRNQLPLAAAQINSQGVVPQCHKATAEQPFALLPRGNCGDVMTSRQLLSGQEEANWMFAPGQGNPPDCTAYLYHLLLWTYFPFSAIGSRSFTHFFCIDTRELLTFSGGFHCISEWVTAWTLLFPIKRYSQSKEFCRITRFEDR